MKPSILKQGPKKKYEVVAYMYVQRLMVHASNPEEAEDIARQKLDEYKPSVFISKITVKEDKYA